MFDKYTEGKNYIITNRCTCKHTHTYTYTLTGGLFSIQYALSWQSNTTRSGFFLSLPALTHIRTDTNIEKEAEDFKNPPVHTVVPHLV